MRPRSSTIHAAALLLTLGAVALSAHALDVFNPNTRIYRNGNGHQVTRPTPAPRLNQTVVVIDRIRYRLGIDITRYIGGQPNPDGSANITTTSRLYLTRIDGKSIPADLVTPYLTFFVNGQPTNVDVFHLSGSRPSERFWNASGSNNWPNNARVNAEVIFNQRNGTPVRALIRSVPLFVVPLP